MIDLGYLILAPNASGVLSARIPDGAWVRRILLGPENENRGPIWVRRLSLGGVETQLPLSGGVPAYVLSSVSVFGGPGTLNEVSVTVENRSNQWQLVYGVVKTG